RAGALEAEGAQPHAGSPSLASVAAASSSSAWAWARPEPSMPASIRDSSPTRPASSSRRTSVLVVPSAECFSTVKWRSAGAAVWGRGGATRTWGGRGRLGQAAPDGGGGAATDPGVDLVEDQGGGAVAPGQHDPQGEHDPGQLAPG